MDFIKARKQGNSIMLTIPSSFNIPAGTKFKPYLTTKGIYYKFVDDDFFDFDEDILKDLVSQGYEGQELIDRFSKMKKAIPRALDKLIEDAKADGHLTKNRREKNLFYK